MNQTTKPALPLWFKVIASVALLWNLMGYAVLGTNIFALEAAIEAFTEEEKEWARSIPSWVYYVHGLAVTAGLAGCIGLFMRKSWTVAVFAISLAAVIVQMVYSTIIAGGLEVMGPSNAVMPLLVIVIAAALLWLSWFAPSQNWFREASSTVESE